MKTKKLKWYARKYLFNGEIEEQKQHTENK